MILRLPRIASTVIERNRVTAWFEHHAGDAVRLLVAPAGSGKTTCAVLYARGRSGPIAFASLPPATDRARLFATLARALDLATIDSYECLIDRLSASSPLELIVDNIDAADHEARDVLAQLYLDVPAAVRFIYIMRGEETLPMRAARAQGFAQRCDTGLFAFDVQESLCCAEAFGLRPELKIAAEIRTAANGWPIAVAGACRNAALGGTLLSQALADWLSEHAQLRSPAPAIVELFGRFELTIAGRPVPWIRRRDRQIVQFLAMQPHGSATRHELVTAFWPEADRQLAGQSLRTACSTIRRALGACTGPANVGRYFRCEPVIALDLTNAVVSAHEYAQYYALATAADERADRLAALSYYRAADRIYRSPFLAGEPPAAWAAPFVQQFEKMQGVVAARLTELGGSGRGAGAQAARRSTLYAASA